MKGVRDIELLSMIWIYSALRATSTKKPSGVAYRRTSLDRHLSFCASQRVFRHSGRLPRIDHINTDGFGLDRGNNGSPGPGTRTLFIIGYTVFLGPRLTAGAPGFRSFSQSARRVLRSHPLRSPGWKRDVALIRRRSDHWALVADKAPSPFRAAIHSGKVPPRWGAILAS